MKKNYWLMKSEPDAYSIDHLKKDQTTWWEGVRNYQARNFMTQSMQLDDEVLFYHSNAEPSGLAGIAVVSKLAQPDQLQFNKKSEFYDPKATLQKPNWFCVEVKYVAKFKNFIPLSQIKTEPKLAGMLVIKKGSRLSIQPVDKKDFDWIISKGQPQK